MALFGKKSEEEELVNKLIGGFFCGDLFKLAEVNGLKKKVDDNNEATAIAQDIENILKKKVKNNQLPFDEIELYFYFIFKQAMYINENLFFREGYCSNCNRDMEDDKYHIFSCRTCGKDFFDAYIIDYDELDELKINLPNDDKSPYRDLGDELSNYIQKQKPNSNYEKIKKVLPECLEKLGVSESECHIVEIVSKINSDNFGQLQLAIMTVYNDKLSYIPIADFYKDKGYVFYEDKGKEVLFETNINFNQIVDINFPSDKYCKVDMTNNNIVMIQYLKTKTSLDDFVNKLTSFLENSQDAIDESTEVNEINDLDTSEEFKLPDDVNPMEKIKEAKELFDIGAITQEEFDEIKAKYMKFI